MIITQRSRLENFEQCPRRGYFAYLYRGQGISRMGFDPDLLLGHSVHTGIELLLRGLPEEEAAAAAAIEVAKAIEESGLAPLVVETEWGFDQVDFNPAQKLFMVNMAEALVRGFARTRLPHLLADFEVLEIEQEESYPLSDTIRFLSRSDLISRRRSDGQLFIHNWKTAKWPDGHWRKKFQYDQQTMSELLGAEQRHGEKFGGIIIEALVKGIKNIEYPKGSGIRYSNSPLLWAWAGPPNDPFPADLRVKYEWTDESGKNRRLGPSYTRVPAFTVMPIASWIDKVEQEAPEVLAAQFVTLPVILRNPKELESWTTSVRHAEYSRAIKLRSVELAKGSEAALDINFPQHTSGGNCLGFGETTCPFFKICHEGASPDDPDLFKPREFNHPLEQELMTQLTQSKEVI